MNTINVALVILGTVCLSKVYAANDYYTVQKLPICKLDHPADIPGEWITMVHSCGDLMLKQVREELRASLTYLAMGAHFSRDTVNRPGFAKYFFDSAREEREHAIKFIGYLSMRGNLTEYDDILKLIPTDVTKNIPTSWNSAADAVRDALKLETSVTELIKNIIIECEKGKNYVGDNLDEVNDYHLSDWLTGEFLDEQYKGQRELAGKLSTLRKMEGSHGKLGEFLVDKKLL